MAVSRARQLLAVVATLIPKSGGLKPETGTGCHTAMHTAMPVDRGCQRRFRLVGSQRDKPPLPMKPSKSINMKSRAAAKAASRRDDLKRLGNGDSPKVIQRENCIFPPGYFQQHRIINFASAVGK